MTKGRGLAAGAARRKARSACRVVAVCVWAGAVGLDAFAQSCDGFGGYGFRGSVRTPSAGEFQDVITPMGDGRVLVVAGNDVYVETSAGSRRWRLWTTLAGDGAPVIYPAFAHTSPDGTRVAIGNGFDFVGLLTLDDAEIVWFSASHFDAAWYDNSWLAVRDFGDVNVYDLSTDPSNPAKTLIITDGPYSAGIAFDNRGNLYTGTGLTLDGPSETGWVKVFDFEKWVSILLDNAPPIDYEQEGNVVCDLLSAASLGFDSGGNLHVGGGDFFSPADQDYLAFVSSSTVADALAGLGPADRDDPADVCSVDPSDDDSNWYDAVYNSVAGEMLVRDAWTSTIYVYAPAGGVTCDNIVSLGARCKPRGALRVKARLAKPAPPGGFLYLAVDDIPFRVAVDRRRIALKLRDLGTGEHVATLTDPADCGWSATCSMP